jgi:hypothetical protein
LKINVKRKTENGTIEIKFEMQNCKVKIGTIMRKKRRKKQFASMERIIINNMGY